MSILDIFVHFQPTLSSHTVKEKRKETSCVTLDVGSASYSQLYLDERFDVYSLEVNIIKENIVQVSKVNKRSDEQLNIQ